MNMFFTILAAFCFFVSVVGTIEAHQDDNLAQLFASMCFFILAAVFGRLSL